MWWERFLRKEELVTLFFVLLLVLAGQQGEKRTEQDDQENRNNSAETQQPDTISFPTENMFLHPNCSANQRQEPRVVLSAKDFYQHFLLLEQQTS